MPPRLFLLKPEAESDLIDAFAWYEDQKRGLGSEFLAEMARVLEVIEDFPERYPVIRKETRRALVRRFPYCVFYVSDPDLIAVTAIMHAKRDPRRWQSRN